MFSIFFKMPDSDSDKNWLFPSLMWVIYLVMVICIIIATSYETISMFVDAYNTPQPAFNFLCYSLGLALGWLFGTMLSLATVRVTFELCILVFRIFQRLCALSQYLKNIDKNIVAVASAQGEYGQFVGDRLSEISSSLSGERE